MIRLKYVVVCLALCVASVADAKKFPWLSTQLDVELHGELPINEIVNVRGTLVNFLVPQDNIDLFLFYGGVCVQATDWLRIAPHIGFTPAWSKEGKDAAIVSLWVTVQFSSLLVFLEGDGFLNPDQNGYRGYYSVDYVRDSYYYGAQGEQSDEAIAFGPHIGFTKGPFHIELQYYAGVQEINFGQTVRTLIQLIF